MYKRQILLRVPVTGEVELSYACDRECKNLHSLLYVIENELNINLKDYPNIRKQILDSSNFIKRLPEMIDDVITTKVGDNKNDIT